MKKGNKRTAHLLLFAIILVAIFLRVYGIEKEGMGVDEIVTYTEVLEDSISEIVNQVELHEGIPPLYLFALKIWSLIFGKSLFALRMFSALFSLLTVILVFFLAELMFGKKTISLLSMFFAGTFISEIGLAQEMRLYAFFGFLVLCSFYFFFRFVKSGEYKIRYIILLGISNLLLLYTNYISLIVFVIQYIILIHFYKTDKNEGLWLKSLMICIILALPSFWLNIKQIMIIYPRKPLQFMNMGFPSLLAIIISVTLLTSQYITSIVLVAALFFYRKSRKLLNLNKFRMTDTTLIILSIAVVILMVLFRDYFIRSFALIRYASFMFFLAYILLPYFLIKMKSKKLRTVVIGLLVITNSFLLVEFFSNPQKMEWKKAIEHISPETGDYIVFAKGGYYVTAFDYHTESRYNNKIILVWSEQEIKKVIATETLTKQLSTVNEFWLIAPRMKGKPIEHKEQIETMFTLKDYKKFHNLEIYKYKKR